MGLRRIGTNLLRNAAPTLLAALALPPPFNVIATGVATSVLDEYLPADIPRRQDGKPKIAPQELEKAIERNAEDPGFAAALAQAEAELQRYEIDSGLRFREIGLEDRKRATGLHAKTGIAEDAFKAGMRLVYLAVGSLALLMVGLLVVITGTWAPDATQTDLTIAAFGVIGTAVGFVNGIASNVVSFYWGSSQGSKDKSDAMNSNLRELGGQLAKASAQVEAQRLQQQVPTPTTWTGNRSIALAGSVPNAWPEAADAAGFGVEDVLGDLIEPHNHFPESVKWALVVDGISVDGAAAARTYGEPKTVRRIWEHYGTLCQEWARSYGVPVELIVATIATETSGKRDARRFEPNLNQESVGLMQTLVSSANGALGRTSISGDDLLDPSLSIQAGTAFIARQRNETSFDPPLVAAAYNAGSLRKEDAEANKWRLRCHPINTGDHVTRFTEWFGDAMRVSAAADWSLNGTVPSFAHALGAPRPQGEKTKVADAQLPESRLLEGWSGSLSLVDLATKSDLAKEVQRALSLHGYLDPPPDGQFGSVSEWALKTHCRVCALPIVDEMNDAVANSLLAPLGELPDWANEGRWFDRVVQYMHDQGHWYCRVPNAKNIVYLEGVNPDGTLNPDAPNVFNDLRCVFWLDDTGNGNFKVWEATTEPGKKHTVAPLNSRGAARIKFGQYKAWRVGIHNGDHEGLRQVMPIPVHRDFDKNFIRAGDAVDTGLFGINQHWGYDLDREDIRGASAGCLVGRTKEGHREFMDLIKSDPRFLVRPNYKFITTILLGEAVLS